MTILLPGHMRLYDNALPKIRPEGANRLHSVAVSLNVQGPKGVIAAVAPSTIQYELVDPGATELSTADVLAVYPPAGAEDESDVMLPHIVLRARSLPWANAITGMADSPWVALLLFVEAQPIWPAEPTLAVHPNGRRIVKVPNSSIPTLLPTPSERALLCHVRELPTDDPLTARDDDAFVAIVVGNRLPVPGVLNRVCLVDLRNVSTSPDHAEFIVLYEWSFKVGSGGDFEEHFRRLRNPQAGSIQTGGVVAIGCGIDGNPIADEHGAPVANDDGEVFLAAPTPTQPQRLVNYAGPCVPLPRLLDDESALSVDEALAVRPDGREVITYSAAFELGRLMALSDPAILEGLVYFRDHQFRRHVDIVLDVELQNFPQGTPAFRGSWKDIFNDIWGGPWMPNAVDILWNNGADPTGLRDLVGKIPGFDQSRLQQLAQMGGTWFELALSKIDVPQASSPALSSSSPFVNIGVIDWNANDVSTVLGGVLPELKAFVSVLEIDEEGLP